MPKYLKADNRTNEKEICGEIIHLLSIQTNGRGRCLRPAEKPPSTVTLASAQQQQQQQQYAQQWRLLPTSGTFLGRNLLSVQTEEHHLHTNFIGPVESTWNCYSSW